MKNVPNAYLSLTFKKQIDLSYLEDLQRISIVQLERRQQMPRPIKPKISESQNYIVPALNFFNHESLHVSIKSKKKYYSLVQRLLNIFLCDETTQMSLFEVHVLLLGQSNIAIW